MDKVYTEDYSKEKAGLITHTRTLVFNETGQEMDLVIKKILYPKEYNIEIDIPVN